MITPWNNPVYLAVGKIAPAVIHGNTVVWKPAPERGNCLDASPNAFTKRAGHEAS